MVLAFFLLVKLTFASSCAVPVTSGILMALRQWWKHLFYLSLSKLAFFSRSCQAKTRRSWPVATHWSSDEFFTHRGTETEDWTTEATAAKLLVVPATIYLVDQVRKIHDSYGYTREYKSERLYRSIAGASVIAVSLEISKSIVGAVQLNGS